VHEPLSQDKDELVSVLGLSDERARAHRRNKVTCSFHEEDAQLVVQSARQDRVIKRPEMKKKESV
jgi:hypothetical protein